MSGKTCRRVPKERANEVIAGSMVANDVSIRDWQMASQTMTMGKSCEVYGVLVTVYCCGMSLVGTESESTAGALECGPDSLDS